MHAPTEPCAGRGMQSRRGQLFFFSLPPPPLFGSRVVGWLFGRGRERGGGGHAWVAPGDKQTFIPTVSCLLDLRGATDSSWIHLALVKHVQR